MFVVIERKKNKIWISALLSAARGKEPLPSAFWRGAQQSCHVWHYTTTAYPALLSAKRLALGKGNPLPSARLEALGKRFFLKKNFPFAERLIGGARQKNFQKKIVCSLPSAILEAVGKKIFKKNWFALCRVPDRRRSAKKA